MTTAFEQTTIMPLADDDMCEPLDSKPLAIRDAADVADGLLCVLISNHEAFPTGQSLILDRAAFGLIQQDDPDLVQLGYLMVVEAVLLTPTEVLGQVLHMKARELRATLAEGMPRINA